MSTTQISSITRTWYKWKAMRLPWRKRFLVGWDLQGNTYWEFRLTRAANERMRRIVKYPQSTHLSSVKVSPQWHQWLRYTRDEPPTEGEQKGDVVRQARMKKLAAEADARWEAKPRVMEAPREEPSPMLASRESPGQGVGEKSADVSKTEENDPWAKAKGRGPSEGWQPTAWSPGSAKKR